MIGNYATINRFASVLEQFYHYIFQKLDSKTVFFLWLHSIHWCHALLQFNMLYCTNCKKRFYISCSVLYCNPDAKRLYDEILSNYNKAGSHKYIQSWARDNATTTTRHFSDMQTWSCHYVKYMTAMLRETICWPKTLSHCRDCCRECTVGWSVEFFFDRSEQVK